MGPCQQTLHWLKTISQQVNLWFFEPKWHNKIDMKGKVGKIKCFEYFLSKRMWYQLKAWNLLPCSIHTAFSFLTS